MNETRQINVDVLSRVEGEGGLKLHIEGGRVTEARLDIFEPPRFFEALLRGRSYTEAPDITARICGICPVAYLMSACHAMEDACGVRVEGPLRDLRRLLYCGEWIASHMLHIAMLHAPDYFDCADVIELAAKEPAFVERALRLKKIGNRIMRLIGGREVHPINVRVGGFHRVPTNRELDSVREDLEWGLKASLANARFAAGLPFADFERDYELVALVHADEYPLNEGVLRSTKGLNADISQYDEVFQESHVAHSTALHTFSDGRGAVHVGPMARFALCADALSPLAASTAAELGLDPSCRNPFKSILVRAVEVVYAFEEALRLIDTYAVPDAPYVDITPRAGIGHGCTEAPRGICYHRYEIADDGEIVAAKIVAPTSVNQRIIEQDIEAFATENLHLTDDQLQWRCEQAIRNYDPCISCSVHVYRA